MNFFFDVFHELTKEFFSKRRAMRAQLIVLLVSSIGVMVAVSTLLIDRATLQNKEYQEQIESLNETERNLKQLITFIETQKAKLVEAQSVVKSLKEEETKLRPIVEANRELVDAILDVQNTRNRTHIWKERIISFLLGIIASIVAVLLLTAINRARKTSRKGGKRIKTQ